MEPGMTEVEAVLAADRARLQAILASDADALDRLSADELTFVHANGRQDDKTTYLDSVRDGRIRYRAITRGESAVKVTGNVAILCASVNVEVTIEGAERSSPVRYMSVWTKHADDWRMLAIDMVRAGAG
jgi:ketosteroid isomerase-like protein